MLKSKTLLPNGFQDVIAPQAGHTHQLMVDIIETFHQFHYNLVEAPLLEYEDSLLKEPSALKSQDIFRFVDPISHQTIGLRGDITLQVVRMARDHLSNTQRPLRLAYYGQVFRIATTDLRPQRQFLQLGIEQVGGDKNAEIEVIQVALEALEKVKVSNVCLDFVLPTLLREHLNNIPDNCIKMLNARNIGSIQQQIQQGVIDKDTGALLKFLLLLPPDPDTALENLSGYPAFHNQQDMFEQLRKIIAAVRVSHPKTQISLDVIERHGFGYKTGIGFNLFAKGQNTSLGRGGRYQAGNESACGVSFNLSNLLVQTQPKKSDNIIAIMHNADFYNVRTLQEAGWITIFSGDPKNETQADHYFEDGQILSSTRNTPIK